jgi:hypothetical protein
LCFFKKFLIWIFKLFNVKITFSIKRQTLYLLYLFALTKLYVSLLHKTLAKLLQSIVSTLYPIGHSSKFIPQLVRYFLFLVHKLLSSFSFNSQIKFHFVLTNLWFLGIINRMSKSVNEIMTRPTTKRVKLSESENRDRLSDLPESLILHVLSFLKSTKAVQTCVLSQRYKDLWKHLPTLILHSSDFPTYELFNKFLSLHNSSIPLQALDFI